MDIYVIDLSKAGYNCKMNYLLIEFLGVFFLMLFRGLSNLTINADDNIPAVFNAVVTGFTLIIFVIYSEGLSRGMFNSSFVIVENLWKSMTVDSALGYIAAQLIACLFATSILSLIVPFEMIQKPGEFLPLGLVNLDLRNDYFSIFTVEMVGSFLLFFGFLYYSDSKATDKTGSTAIYYGALATALQIANYRISGGVYNLALMLGGLMFDTSLDPKLLGLFFGNLFGTIIGKMLYVQLLGPKKAEETNKTLNKMLNK